MKLIKFQEVIINLDNICWFQLERYKHFNIGEPILSINFTGDRHLMLENAEELYKKLVENLERENYIEVL